MHGARRQQPANRLGNADLVAHAAEQWPADLLCRALGQHRAANRPPRIGQRRAHGMQAVEPQPARCLAAPVLPAHIALSVEIGGFGRDLSSAPSLDTSSLMPDIRPPRPKRCEKSVFWGSVPSGKGGGLEIRWLSLRRFESYLPHPPSLAPATKLAPAKRVSAKTGCMLIRAASPGTPAAPL